MAVTGAKTIDSSYDGAQDAMMIRRIRDSIAEYRGLPRTVWALAGARFVNAVGAYVFPFLTLLLTERAGFNEEQTGRVLMIITTLVVPGSLLGGVLADRFGRKRLLVTAQIMAALCVGIIGFMPLGPNIVYLLMAEAFFSGLMMPASSAATYDLTVPANRKASFSLLYLAWNLGFALGPLMAGYLYESHTRWLFLGDAGTTLLSLVLIIIFLPETLPKHQGEGRAAGRRSAAVPVEEPLLGTAERDTAELDIEGDAAPGEKAVKGNALALLLKRPVLLSFVILLTIPWFVYSQHAFALPLFLKELLPAGGAVLYGKIMSSNAVIVVLLTVPLVRLTHKLRPITNVALHSILYALGFGMLFYFRSPAAFYVSVLIWTSGEILGATNIEVFTANHTPSSHRGRFTSILPLISGSGRAVSPWLTGIFLLSRPTEAVWIFCFVLSAASALSFVILGAADLRRNLRLKTTAE